MMMCTLLGHELAQQSGCYCTGWRHNVFRRMCDFMPCTCFLVYAGEHLVYGAQSPTDVYTGSKE
jgi:hypothetical protein